MARIYLDTIEKIEKERTKIQEKVKATYSVFVEDDQKFFQLDTYGRQERKRPEKISQTIQLSEKDAKFLIDLLKQTFNLE